MINLPPDIKQAVERHVASGRFANAEDVLRAAMQKLEASDIESLRESLADEQVNRMKPLADVASDVRNRFGFADSE